MSSRSAIFFPSSASGERTARAPASAPLRLVLFAVCMAALLFLSGCIEVYVRQQFYPNGRSTVLQQINLGPAISTLQSAGIPPPAPYGPRPEGWDDLISAACDNVSVAEPGSHCHIVQGWLVIDQDRVPGSDYVLTSYEAFPYTVYELTVLQMPAPPLPMLESVGEDRLALGRNFTGANRTAVAQAVAAHMRYNYTVSLPGEITQYSAGTLVNGELRVDALSQMALGKPLYVKSRTLNLPQMALLVIVGLDLLLFFDLAFIWVLHEWKRWKKEAALREQERENEEARKRIFRKNKRLKDNEVYAAEEKEAGHERAPDLIPEWEE